MGNNFFSGCGKIDRIYSKIHSVFAGQFSMRPYVLSNCIGGFSRKSSILIFARICIGSTGWGSKLSGNLLDWKILSSTFFHSFSPSSEECATPHSSQFTAGWLAFKLHTDFKAAKVGNYVSILFYLFLQLYCGSPSMSCKFSMHKYTSRMVSSFVVRLLPRNDWMILWAFWKRTARPPSLSYLSLNFVFVSLYL